MSSKHGAEKAVALLKNLPRISLGTLKPFPGTGKRVRLDKLFTLCL